MSFWKVSEGAPLNEVTDITPLTHMTAEQTLEDLKKDDLVSFILVGLNGSDELVTRTLNMSSAEVALYLQVASVNNVNNLGGDG